MLKPLPLSTASFPDIIQGGYLYVDKTEYLYPLIRDRKGVFFLSRPRRFGKSLTVSTLEAIFRGQKELFQGLWLYNSDYQWESHPILQFNFSLYRVRTAEEMETVLRHRMRQIAESYQISVKEERIDFLFDELIQKMSKEQQVVILIDEYDKPLIDNLENVAEAVRIREVLKIFYTIIKALDAKIRFVFITGISKFTRVGVFSTINHLTDLTMSPAFSTMLGITQDELTTYFAGYLTELAKEQKSSESDLLTKIGRWYNGFRFSSAEESVYNPFSIVHLLWHKDFSNYWFASGTPTFLIKLIRDRGYDVRELFDLEVTELAFSAYELEALEIVPLLFQTGYLTIKDFYYEGDERIYKLDHPNYEVQHAFLTYLLSEFSHINRTVTTDHIRQLIQSLRTQDFAHFFTVLTVFFANIPYELQIKKEKYYQTIFHVLFLLIGTQATVETRTNQGRIDATIELPKAILIFEFKLDGTAAEALQQIKDQKYAEKYLLRGKPITLIGANFDSETRTVTDWQAEAL